MDLYTDDSLISPDELRQAFVHKVQHLSDLQQHIESYQTEFRAYWIQPGPTPPPDPMGLKITPSRTFHPLGGRLMDDLPSSQGKVTYQEDVKVANSKTCNVCPTPAPQSKKGALPASTVGGSVKTAFKNPRQQWIFEHLLKNYPHQ